MQMRAIKDSLLCFSAMSKLGYMHIYWARKMVYVSYLSWDNTAREKNITADCLILTTDDFTVRYFTLWKEELVESTWIEVNKLSFRVALCAHGEKDGNSNCINDNYATFVCVCRINIYNLVNCFAIIAPTKAWHWLYEITYVIILCNYVHCNSTYKIHDVVIT